jgi:hypothetical protein
MKNRFWLVFAALLLTQVAPLLAVTYLAPTDAALVDRSDAIVRGRVVSIDYRVTPEGVYQTVATVRVARTLKGDRAKTVEITQVGGTDGVRWTAIAGAPQYRVGEESLFFLKQNSDGSWRTFGLALGKFDLVTTADGRRYAVRETGEMIDQQGGKVDDSVRLSDSFERFVSRHLRGDAAEEKEQSYTTHDASARKMVASSRVFESNYSPDNFLAYNFGGVMAKWPTATYTIKSTGAAQTGISAASSVASAQNAANAWNGYSSGAVNFASASSGGTVKP